MNNAFFADQTIVDPQSFDDSEGSWGCDTGELTRIRVVKQPPRVRASQPPPFPSAIGTNHAPLPPPRGRAPMGKVSGSVGRVVPPPPPSGTTTSRLRGRGSAPPPLPKPPDATKATHIAFTAPTRVAPKEEVEAKVPKTMQRLRENAVVGDQAMELPVRKLPQAPDVVEAPDIVEAKQVTEIPAPIAAALPQPRQEAKAAAQDNERRVLARAAQVLSFVCSLVAVALMHRADLPMDTSILFPVGLAAGTAVWFLLGLVGHYAYLAPLAATGGVLLLAQDLYPQFALLHLTLWLLSMKRSKVRTTGASLAVVGLVGLLVLGAI